MGKKRGSGSFGARPCRSMRERYFKYGEKALPKSWRKRWMIQRIVATPPWACFTKIAAVYREAERLTRETGVVHVVDHDIPLQHPLVCGLHVHKNLQAVTEKWNTAKGNYWCPDQMELHFG